MLDTETIGHLIVGFHDEERGPFYRGHSSATRGVPKCTKRECALTGETLGTESP